MVIKQQTTVADKVKHRLEQLDDFEEVRRKIESNIFSETQYLLLGMGRERKVLYHLMFERKKLISTYFNVI